MLEAKLTDLLISDPAAINYYLGYHTDPGERLFLLNMKAKGKPILYLNKLFPEAIDLDKDLLIKWYSDGESVLETIAQDLDSDYVGIDKNWPSHFLISLLQLEPQLKIMNGSLLVDQQRSIKSLEEQEIMIEASRLNDKAMEQIIEELPKGLSELEMVDRLEKIYKDLGMEGLAFEPIIAYGPNGADPHHITSHDKAKIGDSVIIDIGAFYKGYASDMTRTVFYGQASEEALSIYNIVKEANQAAINHIKPGRPISDLDKIARDIITKAGYGKYFTHRLGHFIGQETHEYGDVSQYNDNLLQVGQVFSIEPGIYIPGLLGVRIEDLVLVTEDGCKVLNQVNKDAQIISLN